MMHTIWATAKENDPDLDLDDPLVALEEIWHTSSYADSGDNSDGPTVQG